MRSIRALEALEALKARETGRKIIIVNLRLFASWKSAAISKNCRKTAFNFIQKSVKTDI